MTLYSPKRQAEYDLPDDGTFEFCSWCDSPVNVNTGSGAGRADGNVWCSRECEKIVKGTHWPTEVGPATHDEILEWIEEAERQAESAHYGPDPFPA